MVTRKEFSNGFAALDPQTIEWEQSDLDALCADRPMPIHEIFRPNAYYGCDQIVKAYAGLPRDRPLKVALQHGVEISVLTNVSRREDVPVITYCAEARDEVYRRMGARTVWPMAAPFVYMLELTEKQEPDNRRGTIFFPVHSGFREDGDPAIARYDVEAIADRLTSLPTEQQPVTVCMYWADYRLGLHEPFARRGMRLVSAGHIFDDQFLFRFHALCRQHRYAASSDVGSHCFYAVKAGCHYFHLESLTDWRDLYPEGESTDLMYEHVRSIMRKMSEIDHGEQARIVDAFLGTRHFLPPGELAAMFSRAEKLDRFGFCLVRENSGRPRSIVTGPWFLRRWVKTFLRPLVYPILRRVRAATGSGLPSPGQG